jgi:AcrR family transcriptional regulator
MSTTDPVAITVEGLDGRSVPRARNRERLLGAASVLFAQRGYRGTTTRDIADAAGITERTLFRHVPSKAALFRDAVIVPVEAFVSDFAARWRERPRGSRDTETEVREFYQNLLAVVQGERTLLVAVMAALACDDGDPDTFPELKSMFAPLLDELEAIFAVEAELRHWQLDPRIAVRMIVGTALAVTVHAEWLFAGHRVPAPETMIAELTRFTVWGLAGAPPDG